MSNSQIEVISNGKHFFKVSAAYVAAVSSILGIVIFCGGWILGYVTFKSDVENLKEINKSVQTRLDILSGHITEDRQMLTNRLTGLESETKFISQGVAELKIANVPKR